jgi:FkbM family methyltransferase
MNLSPSRVTPLVVDHARRVGRASAGFRSVGLAWTRPWFFYLGSPLLNRIQRQGVLRFQGFVVRLGKADLYTFANLFEDYPVCLVRRALAEVSLVLDLGANVGAFSWLITHLSEAGNLRPRIVALEPNAENASFLRAQPFAAALEIDEAAVGPSAGMGTLVPGENSVTDHVDYSGRSAGATVPIRSLDSLCDRPALVKMDIEGGEREILQQGLPEQVRHLFLEWHPVVPGGTRDSSTPADFVPGKWRHLSSDPYGSTTWYFQR